MEAPSRKSLELRPVFVGKPLQRRGRLANLLMVLPVQSLMLLENQTAMSSFNARGWHC